MPCVRTAASLLACFLVAAAPASAQDSWGRVPALPTACYNDDHFFETADTAYQEIAAAYRTQYDMNEAIDHQLKELDGAARQQRLMAFLQKDPINGSKFMQEGAMAAQRAGDRQTELDNQRKALASAIRPSKRSTSRTSR